MKHVRNILLFLAIVFGFVMQAEVYQNMLWNFSGAYYLSSKYQAVQSDMDSFLNHAEEIAERHNVHIFSVFCHRDSNYKTSLFIYGDNAVIRDSLKKTMDLEEKTYTALIGGITVVEFRNFSEAKDSVSGQELLISYVGDEDSITAAYQDLAEAYTITQPEYWQSTETDMMVIVWGLVAVLMIVLNGVEVMRRQKEVVVRASLGENAAVIALRAAVIDLISYAVLFALAGLLASRFLSGAYEKKLVLAVYCAGAVLSVVPYLAFVRFDVRKAFSNASEKKWMFYLLHGLKVTAAAMTVLTIATNLSSIRGNLFTSGDLLENHLKDSYFEVVSLEIPAGPDSDFSDEDEEETARYRFWSELYENEYDVIRPVICIGSRISDMGNYIFVNRNARDMLQGFAALLTEEDEKADMVVFVPEGADAELYRQGAKKEIDALTDNTEELRVVYKEYSGREKFYFLNSNREDAVDGVSSVVNPVVIYQANGSVALNGGYITTRTYNGAILYSGEESSLRNAAQKYADQLGAHYFMLTNVGEDYAYSHSFLVKLISFVSSLCVLVLLLDIAVILSEVKMEFRLRSMELSLKKVLGYSFWERHRRFISVDLAESIAVTVLVCAVSCFMLNTGLWSTFLIGVLLAIVEMAIVSANILWVERTTVAKTLKGGCL